MPLFWEDPNVNDVKPRDRTPLFLPGNYRAKLVKLDMSLRGNRQTIIGTFEVLESSNPEIPAGQLRSILWMVAGTQYPEIGQGNFLQFCNAINGAPVDHFGRVAKAAVQDGIYNGRTVSVQVVGTGKKNEKSGKEYTDETWFVDENAGAFADVNPTPMVPVAAPPVPAAPAVEPWIAQGYIQHPTSPDHVYKDQDVKAKAAFGA